MTRKPNLSSQQKVNEIIEAVLNIEDPDQAINQMLSDFGTMVHADRAYIFELHKGQFVVNTYEWCAPGVEAEIRTLQAVPMAVYEKTWLGEHENGRMIVIEDVERYHDVDPYVYDMLRRQNIQRLITAPMFVDRKFIGFLGIDNPEAKDMQQDADLTNMISSFAASLIRHRDNTERIHKLSERDTVTDSYNITYFLKRMRQEISIGYAGHTLDKTSIIYFNVSQFKVFNDAYGFEEGNQCLRKIFYMLMEVFDTENVSRFFSDHFIVFYFKDDAIDKIREAHDRCYRLDDRIHLWLEAGMVIPKSLEKLAQYCDDGKVACDLIVKDGIQYFKLYNETMGAAIVRKKYLQDTVDDALQKGHVKVYYQPVVRSLTGRLCSLEALSRWDDPRYGMISPAEFIPALEEKHLCYKLDFYVIGQVCRTLRERMDAGEPVVPVSVNLSRRDFILNDPVDVVEKEVSSAHLDRQYICIEITESAVMEDPKLIRHAIARFHELGYKVWMDDFGSAYSSLNTLKDFSFDELKIDMAFLRNMNDKSKAILHDVVHMAKSLGVHTLCEGVETKEQLDYMRSIGCERIQGYYYGKPLPLEEQLDNLRRKHVDPETPEQAEVTEKIGLEPFHTEEAFCLVENNGGNLQVIYANAAFGRLIASDTEDMDPEGVAESVSKVLNDRSISFGRLVHKMTYEASLEKGAEKLFAVINDRSCMFECRNIVDYADGCIEKIRGTDVTDTNNDERFGYLLRCVAGAYNEIYFINRETEEMTVVRSMIPGEKVGDVITLEDSGLISKIDPADRQRFLQTMQMEYRDATIRKLGRESYTEDYLLRRPDGTSVRMAFTTIGINYQGAHDYLLCVKFAALPQETGMAAVETVHDRRLEDTAANASGTDRFRGRTEMLEQLMYLNQKVYTDHQTGIHNRRYYDEHVAGMTVQAVAMVDIDGLKQLNDRFGHHTGDQVLRMIAKTIVGDVRSSDTVVRYGGDEFVISFEKITADVLRRRLEQIRDKIHSLEIPVSGDQKSAASLSVSIGGCYGKGTVRDLLAKADDALYKAEKKGAGQIEILQLQDG